MNGHCAGADPGGSGLAAAHFEKEKDIFKPQCDKEILFLRDFRLISSTSSAPVLDAVVCPALFAQKCHAELVQLGRRFLHIWNGIAISETFWLYKQGFFAFHEIHVAAVSGGDGVQAVI